jgi:alkylated DNA nucleotide flippase Atl1
MENRLGASNLETLALLDLQLCGYEKASRGDTYRLQAQRLRALETDEAQVIADIERLARRAAALAPVLDPSKTTQWLRGADLAITPEAGDPELQAALERLASWGTEATRVVMLAALERLQSGTATREQVLHVAACCESYLVRRMLAGRTAAGVNRILAEAAREMLTAEDIEVSLRRYLSPARRGWPTDAALRQEIQTRNFYWAGKAAQRLFVLRRLEGSYAHKEPVDWDNASPTIEHVMPQSPTPDWVPFMHDPDDPNLPPDDVHEMWVHRLGNLTLTGYNPELSNLPFAVKRDTYRTSHFEMTRRLAELRTWGPPQIRDRAEELADRAIAIWPGPIETGTLSSVPDQWRMVRQILVALPEGTWTSYGDICAVTGGHPVPLGGYLANTPVVNAWRVLTSAGKVSDGFRWPDDRPESAHDVLIAEGIRFDKNGAADPDQRLRPADLAALLGIDTGGGISAAHAAETPPERT